MTSGRNTIIVYNRVPKCGSRTVLELIKWMNKKINVTYAASRVYKRLNITGEEAVRIKLFGDLLKTQHFLKINTWKYFAYTSTWLKT